MYPLSFVAWAMIKDLNPLHLRPGILVHVQPQVGTICHGSLYDETTVVKYPPTRAERRAAMAVLEIKAKSLNPPPIDRSRYFLVERKKWWQLDRYASHWLQDDLYLTQLTPLHTVTLGQERLKVEFAITKITGSDGT